MTEKEHLLTAALAYAARGWHVFPCRPRGKAPLTEHGFKDATTDPAGIRAWWGRWPQANVGVATGASALVVVDVDNKDGQPGLESWRDVLAEYGRGIGETVSSETPTGGLHLVYSADGRHVRNSAGKLGPGLDVRADGGYFVAPPSVHPNGGTYCWALGCSPDDLPPLPLPEALVQLLAEAEAKRAEPIGDEIPQGQRNETLVSLAGSMRRRGAGEAAILAALRATNEEQCQPPLSDTEVVALAKGVMRYAPVGRQRAIGERLPKEAAALAAKTAPSPPDAALREAVIDLLLGTGEKPKPPVLRRRQRAGQALLSWLRAHGDFVQSPDGDLFYFLEAGRRLYNLATNRWAAYLYALSGANPAGPDYAYLLTDCKVAAMSAEARPILRAAAWDDQTKALRVSRFDGTVYVLDGMSIEMEANGAHVLFDDDPLWQPYRPDWEGDTSPLYWLTTELPNWKSRPEAHGLALRAWILTTFLTELCPTRPILIMLGDKDSGKSMTLRMMLRLLFGRYAQLSGVPDKPDGFTAAAAASHVLALDNVDEFTPWLRDKLARLATGATDEYRKLFTSNEVGRVRYRTWLALTARTPETLRRDDVADRLLLLPVATLEPARREIERGFLAQSLVMRGRFWGDLLTRLNQVVGAIRAGTLAARSEMRMADWETVGRVVAATEGRESEWRSFVSEVKPGQTAFLLEGDLLLEGLRVWLPVKSNHGRLLTARQLQEEWGHALFGDKKPPRDWPRSSKGFGKRLVNIREALQSEFRVEWGLNRTKTYAYQFWPKGVPGDTEDAGCAGFRNTFPIKDGKLDDDENNYLIGNSPPTPCTPCTDDESPAQRGLLDIGDGAGDDVENIPF